MNRGLTGTYTTPPVSRGRYGQETTRSERWRVHSLARIQFAPSFWYGIREDNGELVHLHAHRIEFDLVPGEPKETKEAKEKGQL
jgi:hypothetical protein